MGNLVTDYREARALLRLGPYEAWLVDCIINLLMPYDNRVAAQNAAQLGRKTGGMTPGWRLSSTPGPTCPTRSRRAFWRWSKRQAVTVRRADR